MDAMLHTDEEGSLFGITAGDSDPAHNPRPAPPIKVTLAAALAKYRQEFADLRQQVAQSAPFADYRPRLVAEAKRVGQRVNETRDLLSCKHWQEFADPAEDRTLSFY